MKARLPSGLRRFEQMVVLPRGPLRRAMFGAALVLACAGLSFAGYLMGLRRAGFDRAELASLEARSRILGQEVEELQVRLVEEQLQGEVNERAKVDLQAKINDQRGELLMLREKVALYEALLSSDAESGR
ncbi:MAG: hypothetical protein OXF68_14135 [Gammaproteobacteria bacterium]|nr:hypothetical protein [Gammaproteobacteria bacterium]MCY4342544.1 hypothetical protein [Gammaproteobacteria bacterium]